MASKKTLLIPFLALFLAIGLTTALDLPKVEENPTTTHDLPEVAEKPTTTHDLPEVAEKPTITHDLPEVTEKPTTTHDLPEVTEKPTITHVLPNVAEKPATTHVLPNVAEKNDLPQVAEKPTTTHDLPEVAEKPTATHDLPKVAENPTTTHDLPKLKATDAVVEGVVYCQSCDNYGTWDLAGGKPIEAATVSVICKDHRNRVSYYKACQTDKNGYFYVELKDFKMTKYFLDHPLHSCKAKLVSSPLKTCNLVTNVNYGLYGAPLRYKNKRIVGKNYEAIVYAAGPLAFRPAGCVAK